MEVVRDCTITPYSTLFMYQNTGRISDGRALGYSTEGQDFSAYISVHRLERLAEIHIGCLQSSVEDT